jgi:HPt (histidine-containing phosphotransfer) domain-containing protein
MAAAKSAVTKAVQAEREKASALDLRRQKQIANQIDIINRLSDQGGYDDVMQDLVARLTEAQAALNEAKAEISRLQAEKAGG